jgi:hypothetical protein
MKSGIARVITGIVISTAAAGAMGAAAARTQVEAKLLDRNEYQCSNCFFGSSSYYYCFEAGDKILIGYQKTPELNWKEHSSNLLTRVHKQWLPWVSEGETVPLSYDEKTIRVTRPNGKSVKLRQDYNTDIFINSARCRAAVKKHAE